MYDIVTVQGVGERVGQPQSRMAEYVLEHLNHSQFREVPCLDYVTVGPVGVDPGPSLDFAVARVARSLIRTISDTPNPAVLIGYSGGALVAGNVAEEIADGLYPDLDVRGVVLIADPAMPRGISPDGYGVYADRATGIPTLWLWDSRDPICCAGDPSPLHTLSDQLAALSFGAPDVWAQDLYDRLRSGRWQQSAFNLFDLFGTFRRYSRAIDQMGFYLTGGHFEAYRYRGHEAAAWIRQVTA
ncbi:alpha/beta fold hydrolase [Tomitella gaofuii]|uniref:alpha/beta fold hydrolase n=1 Tax=Tomitella gaofuii TaxID=2760083 RepID=UPI0015FD5FCF|nr:alpha/beta fold hydrolase [Tomitella gaofuii]